MNRDDVIRMARDAGGADLPIWRDGTEMEWAELERFAALVAAAEREACIEAARTVGGDAGAEVEKLIRARGQG